MLIKHKLILGSLIMSIFTILVVSIVLIDSNKTLNNAIQLTNQYNIINTSIIEATREEKSYFLFEKKTLDKSDMPYLKKFKLALSIAKEAAKNNKKIVKLIDKYGNYFEQIIDNNNINDKSIKTLQIKAQTLQEAVSDKIEYVQKKAQLAQKRVYSILLIAFAIIGGTSIYGGIFLSRLVSVPLKGLLSSAKKISEGAVDTKIEITTQDEIGNLGYILNKIIEDVNKVKKDFKKEGNNLEIKIDKQTKQLQEEQENIIKSEKTAVLEQLATAVFSGLKICLTNLSSLSDRLEEKVGKENREVSGCIRNIDNEINRITRMNYNILRYSKTPVLNFEPGNINKIIEEILLLKEKENTFENIKVVRRLHSGISQISLDVQQMRQLFDNLLTNACQSMSKGGELIICTNTGAGEIEIKIIDAGSGIVTENLGKIFAPFFSTKSGSIGLGLTVVRKIITQHHGNIAVQSSIEKGTTVIIKLPMHQKQENNSV